MSHLLCSIVSGSRRGSLCLLVGVMQREVAHPGRLSPLCASDYTPESRSQYVSGVDDQNSQLPGLFLGLLGRWVWGLFTAD